MPKKNSEALDNLTNYMERINHNTTVTASATKAIAAHTKELNAAMLSHQSEMTTEFKNLRFLLRYVILVLIAGLIGVVGGRILLG